MSGRVGRRPPGGGLRLRLRLLWLWLWLWLGMGMGLGLRLGPGLGRRLGLGPGPGPGPGPGLGLGLGGHLQRRKPQRVQVRDEVGDALRIGAHQVDQLTGGGELCGGREPQ